MMRGVTAILALVLSVFWPLAGRAQTQSVESFYRGKTITVLIGYGVGGSDDLWARLLARYMGRHIPGQPLVVPQNMPGAGSLVAANQVYNVSPKDGTVIGVINRGVPFEAVLGGGGVQFDPRKFNWLGSPDSDVIVAYVRTDAPIRHVSELRDKELIVAATGSGADSQTYPQVLARLFGWKLRIVQGYPGSRDMNLAVERNEAHGTFISYDTAAREPTFRDGSRRLLVQGAMTPDERMKDVPTLAGLAQSEAEQRAVDFFLLRAGMGRPFVVAPGVPPERLSALRDAFAAALRDPDLIEESKKLRLNISYVPPDALQTLVEKAYGADAQTLERVRQALR
jgi:tripartite-type tricarboxylate transporter receptor subunit TctC